MHEHDQKILNVINDLMHEKDIHQIDLKVNQLFDLIATSPHPIDIARINVLRRVKDAFENIKNANERDFTPFLNSLKTLKEFY